MLKTTALAAGFLWVAPVSADAANIPCWIVKAAIKISGSEQAAEQFAADRGYSRIQIARAKRECLVAKRQGMAE